MSLRQTSGSVVCPSCGKLVGVQDAQCWSCGRRNPGMWGFAPALRKLGNDLGFVEVVTWGCVALYAFSLIADTSAIFGGQGGIFSFLSPSRASLIVFGASGPGPVLLAGRWWTPLSAGWLHGSLLHILFNLLWIRQLARPCADVYGPARTVILYTVSSVVGFLFSTGAVLAPGLFRLLLGGGNPQTITVGASAAIFGLLGALVAYGQKGSSEIGRQAWFYAIILFVFGLFIGRVDNWAHLGGFVGGWAVAHILDPRKPERGNHLVAALACLALTGLAILVSFVTGLDLLRAP